MHKDGDKTYVLDDTARVYNAEAYDGGTETRLVLRAKLTRPNDQSNDNSLWPTARLVLRSGSPVECSLPRAQVWSTGRHFEDFDLPCDSVVEVAKVLRVETIR